MAPPPHPRSTRPVRPPHPIRRVLEPLWLPTEVAGFATLAPLLSGLSIGDGHPVLLLPGFCTDDEATKPLRWALRNAGYSAHAWRLGRNIGPTARAVDGMRARLIELHERHGSTVTLIGHSLGGIYARQLARERSDVVRQVITLGSPYRMVEGDRSAVQWLWDRVRHLHDGELPLLDIPEPNRPPLRVPSTSIYSRADGVATWHTCIDACDDGEFARGENVEVHGSHIGLALNPAVLLVVLDRLAQPVGAWAPFVPPKLVRAWYPRAVSWLPPADRHPTASGGADRHRTATGAAA